MPARRIIPQAKTDAPSFSTSSTHVQDELDAGSGCTLSSRTRLDRDSRRRIKLPCLISHFGGCILNPGEVYSCAVIFAIQDRERDAELHERRLRPADGRAAVGLWGTQHDTGAAAAPTQGR